MTTNRTSSNCERWRDAISALVDGEEPPVERAAVEGHLRRCASCRAYADAARAHRVDAVVRVPVDRAGPSPVAPSGPAAGLGSEADRDVSPVVARAVAAADRAGVPQVARWGLLVVAVQIVVLAVIALVESPAGHEARHAGSFAIAYAIALIVVAARPARARTVLPVSCVLGGALAITAVVDTMRGSTAWLGELLHLPELVSVGLVWLLARRPRDVAPFPVSVSGEDDGDNVPDTGGAEVRRLHDR